MQKWHCKCNLWTSWFNDTAHHSNINQLTSSKRQTEHKMCHGSDPFLFNLSKSILVHLCHTSIYYWALNGSITSYLNQNLLILPNVSCKDFMKSSQVLNRKSLPNTLPSPILMEYLCKQCSASQIRLIWVSFVSYCTTRHITFAFWIMCMKFTNWLPGTITNN